jgi:CHAT domain-containing protein
MYNGNCLSKCATAFQNISQNAKLFNLQQFFLLVFIFSLLSAEMAKESYLTVEDISNLSLQANIVVLSACHTARGAISSEGVLGLARAFLMAGAKSVVTALWAVNDNATEKFMLKFYDNLSSEPVVNALATTMCEMKQEKFEVAQWGSFKVLGANVKVFSHFSDDH